MIFCAIFVSPRATAGVTLALVAALWAGKLAYSAGAEVVVEASSGPLTPSALYVIAAIMLLFVRLLFDDVRRVAAAERIARESIFAIRRAELNLAELAVVSRNLIAPMAVLLEGIVAQDRGRGRARA